MSKRYLLHRFLSVPPIVIGVTIISFALIYLGPVDPITAITPDDATAEQIAVLRHAYGFDRPIPIQYLHMVASGDGWRLRRFAANGPDGSGIAAAGFDQHVWPWSCIGGLASDVARSRTDRDFLDRHQHSELLARNRARHHFLDRAELAAGNGHGTERGMGVGPRARALPDSSCHHDCGHSGQGHRQNGARVGVQNSIAEYVEALHAPGLPYWRVLLHVLRKDASIMHEIRLYHRRIDGRDKEHRERQP